LKKDSVISVYLWFSSSEIKPQRHRVHGEEIEKRLCDLRVSVV